MIKWLFPGIGDWHKGVTWLFVCFTLVTFADHFSQVSLYFLNSRIYARSMYYIQILLFVCLIFSIARLHFPYETAASRCFKRMGWFFLFWLFVASIVYGVVDYKVSLRALLHYAWFIMAIFYLCQYIDGSRMFRFYIISYYILCLVMLGTIHSEVTTFNFAEGEFRAMDEIRMTSSLAYLLKNGLYVGLYLFIVGLVKGKGLGRVSRVLCLAAIVPYLYFDVVEFKFRTAFILTAIAIGFAFFSSLKRLRLVPILLALSVFLIGAVIVFKTDVFSGFIERVQRKNDEYAVSNGGGFLEGERLFEASMMLEEMTPVQHCIGRGFDAHWNASMIFGEKAGWQWRTVHLGAVMPVLYGGWPLCVFMLFIYLWAITRRLNPSRWYFDDLRVCKIFVTVMFIRNIFGPVPFVVPEYADLPQFLSLGMLWMVDHGCVRLLDMKGPYA